MAEISTQPDTLLNREQLRDVERFQARFAELENRLHECVDEFLSVLNRHYFNRENGYLREQEENLREIVTIQSRLQDLSESMAGDARELKERMLGLQQDLQRDVAKEQKPERKDEPEQEEQPPKERDRQKQQPAEHRSSTAAQAASPSRGKAAQGLVLRGEDELTDPGESGGEISLRLIFEGLGLTSPENSEALNKVSTELRQLLYERKLVGYSKTSLVFGKNRTVGEVLDDLSPIFLAEEIRRLLVGRTDLEPGETEDLRLACNDRRELVYLVG